MKPEIKQRIEQLNNGKIPKGYKKTDFGVFPSDWETDKTLGDLFDFYGGLSKSRDELGEEGYAYLHYGDLHRGTFNTVSIDHYEQLPKCDISLTGKEKCLMKDGDVAFLDASEDLEGTSRAVLIDNPENKPFIAGLHIIYGKAKNNSLDKWFKQYITSSESVKKQFQRLSVGFKVYGVNRDTIPRIRVSFPSSLKEQSRIAEILMKWDKAIELYDKQIDALTRYKAVCLRKMFPAKGQNVPEWRFQGFTNAWEQRKLGDMGTTFTGLSGKTKEDFGHGNAQFVTYMNVFTNPISNPAKVEAIEIDRNQNSVQYGDVFFTTSSETPEEVGMSSVWLENTEHTYLNSFCFGYRPVEIINPYYLAYMLRSETVRKKTIYLAQGISRYNISKKGVMQIEVPLPALAEQKLLGKYFRNIDNLITLHQRKKEVIINQRKILQQYLLNGIVRVKS